MSGPAIALSIVAACVIGTLALALYGVRHVRMDPQQFIVGGRSFGTLFLWVLLAGEIYTSFTFLGAAGWAYGMGAPAYYILAYGSCAYVIGYFLLPAIWRVAKERSLLTAPDFFADRYASRALGVGVGLVQFCVMVPYVALQLSGLQLLLRIAGYGRFDATVAVIAAFLLIAAFVFTAGLRGTAWASIVKDVMVLGAVVFAGIAIPVEFFGSWSKAIDQVLRTHPHFLTLAPGTAFARQRVVRLDGAVGGDWVFHGAARHERDLQRAFRGNPPTQRDAPSALPGRAVADVFCRSGGAADRCRGSKERRLISRSCWSPQRYYPPWVLGFVAAAGSLAALVPASAQLLGAASIFAKNVLGTFGIATSDAHRMFATRALVLVVAALALGFWLEGARTLVELILIYYNGITQFAPGVVAAFLWRRATAWGVAAGILVGLALAIALTNSATTPWGLNAGFIALTANVAVMVAVSLLTPNRAPAAIS